MDAPPASLSVRGIVAFGLLLAVLAMTLVVSQRAAAAGASATTTRPCQHPLVTGQEAVNIKNVSPQKACKVVRALARFIGDGSKSGRLYECAGASPTKPGRPVLKIHRFQGWDLKIVKTYGFKMSRGKASFEVTGQDFPLNCS
jgi:hypothetical protein